jgi:hypothetical protein
MLEGIAQKFRRPWFVSDIADVTTVAGLPSGEKGRQKAIAAIVLKLMIEARCLSNEECSEDNGTDTPNATRGGYMWLSTTAQALRPVWLCLLKNQNGPTRWFPLILYPSYFMFRPGNYEAKKEVERVEKNREIYTNAPYFVQVRDDWRYMPTDSKLAKAYVLGQRTSEEKW